MRDNENQPATKADLMAAVEPLKADIHRLDEKIETVNQRLGAKIDSLASGHGQLKATTEQVKTDVAQLKTDTEQVKTDVAQLKTDTEQLKTGVAQLKATTERLAHAVTTLQEDMLQVKEQMFTKEDGRRVITLLERAVIQADDYRKLDVLRGEVVMRHEDQLADHEKRLSVMEQSK